MPKCKTENCKIKHACFNYKGETVGAYCKTHSEPDMIDVVHKMCFTCGKVRAGYNKKGKSPKYCFKHKKTNMIRVESIPKKCIKCKEKSASYNVKDKSPLYCVDCKKDNMINVKNKRKCLGRKGKCAKQPTYNYLGKQASYCKDCKKDDMIDVVHKICFCKKARPTFNYKGKSPKYCNECKDNNMINVDSKMCIKCNKKQAFYSVKGEYALYCSVCKKDNMINVKHKLCIKCNKTHSTYNYPNKPARYCNRCKKDGMIDVSHNFCDCGTRAAYGLPGDKPSKCVSHIEEGMIVNPRTRCNDSDCKELAIYGIRIPTRCYEHKEDNDINLVERKCTQCDKIDIIDSSGLCINFCSKEEQLELYKKQQKIKERIIKELLTKEIREPDSYDKIISSECGRKGRERPDIVFDCSTHIVIVEVDEDDGHKNRCIKGEQNRMKWVCVSYEGAPVTFIRYNPDHKEINDKEKQKILIKWVKKLCNEFPKKLYSVVYLFYDPINMYPIFDRTNVKQYELDPDDDKCYVCKKCNDLTYIYDLFLEHNCE
jgi:hypothetical protein